MMAKRPQTWQVGKHISTILVSEDVFFLIFLVLEADVLGCPFPMGYNLDAVFTHSDLCEPSLPKNTMAMLKMMCIYIYNDTMIRLCNPIPR